MPPRWKTAFVVWVAIYPSITLVLWLAGPRMQSWPLAVRTLAITALVVPLMVYLLLPVLQHLLGPGYADRRNQGEHGPRARQRVHEEMVPDRGASGTRHSGMEHACGT